MFPDNLFKFGHSPPDEPERPKTQCEQHRDSVQTTSPEGYPLFGAFVPQCDPNGQYSAQQVNLEMDSSFSFVLMFLFCFCSNCNHSVAVSQLHWTLLVCGR